MLDHVASLLRKLDCPKGSEEAVTIILPPKSIPFLLMASDEWVSTQQVAKRLERDEPGVEEEARCLFEKGLLDMKDGLYKTLDLESMLGRALGEGRTEVPPQHREALATLHLDLRMGRKTAYLEDGTLLYASSVKVVPDALPFHKHPHEGVTSVLPHEHAGTFLERAWLKVLVPCNCRLSFQRCSKPVMLCILINESARDCLDRGFGREIDMEESREILKIAAEEELVHLAINTESGPYGLCSCCSCCCHDLQAFKKGCENWLIEKAPYIAVDDEDLCTHCGICVDVCAFGARTLESGEMVYDREKCYGCGVCILACPTEVIRLEVTDPEGGK